MKKYFDAQKTTADENLLSGFGQKKSTKYKFLDLILDCININVKELIYTN